MHFVQRPVFIGVLLVKLGSPKEPLFDIPRCVQCSLELLDFSFSPHSITRKILSIALIPGVVDQKAWYVPLRPRLGRADKHGTPCRSKMFPCDSRGRWPSLEPGFRI